METITLAADTTNRIQALAAVTNEDPQVIFDRMLEKGLAASAEERQGLDVRVKGYSAERIETMSALYEEDVATMADRLIRKGLEAMDREDGVTP